MSETISAKSKIFGYKNVMRRPLKKHVQQPLFKPRGGKRARAGRPKQGVRASERHKTRPRLRASEPVHVTVRADASVGRLRKHDVFLAVREATLCVAKYEDFRIVHLSIQGTHLHLIVEAKDRLALAAGMQAFQISAAKQINRAITERTHVQRRGKVFPDRYHARIMRTPREVRDCIAYVLNNWRHHDEHKTRRARVWDIDPFSSGISFSGWKELEDADRMPEPPPTYKPLLVWLPRSYLLSTLWRRHGLIRAHEVPGGNHDEP